MYTSHRTYILLQFLIPEQTRPSYTRTGQVTNVKTYLPHTISSVSLSSTFGQRQQMLKNEDLSQMLHSKRIISDDMQRSPSTGTIKKDLYTIEQDTVGPPGQQRPNNLIRKQFPPSSSAQSASIRMSDRSVDSTVLSVEAKRSRSLKRNVRVYGEKITQS